MMPPRSDREGPILRRLRELCDKGLMTVERIGEAWLITGRGIRILTSSLSTLQPGDLDP